MGEAIERLRGQDQNLTLETYFGRIVVSVALQIRALRIGLSTRGIKFDRSRDSRSTYVVSYGINIRSDSISSIFVDMW